MKDILVYGALSFMLLLSTMADADSRTPITETSYQAATTSAYHSCIGDNGGIDLRKIKGAEWAGAYCACASVTFEMNLRQITAAYHLHFEDEWMAHLPEVAMSRSQVNVCKNKADN